MKFTRELINVFNTCLKNIEDQNKLQQLLKSNLIVWDEEYYIISEKAANDYYSSDDILDIFELLGEGLED